MNNITPEVIIRDKLLMGIKQEEILQEATKELLGDDTKTHNNVYKETTVEKKKNSIFAKFFNIFDLHLLQNVPLVVMIVGLGEYSLDTNFGI